METLKGALLPFAVVFGAVVAFFGALMTLVEAQALFGLPWSYWIVGGGVLAIGALGWTLHRIQTQLNGLAADVEQGRETTEVLRQRVEQVADVADAPAATPAPPGLDGPEEALRALYREQEWARKHLHPRSVGTEKERESFEMLEKEWRYSRVLPAMERAGCSRKHIRAFSRIDKVSGTSEGERLTYEVGMRINMLTVAIADVEKRLEEYEGEGFLSIRIP